MRFLHKFGIFVCASILLVGCATPKGNTVQDKRSYVLNMKNEVKNPNNVIIKLPIPL